jgi:single-strand DNA-binding protein
VSTVNRVHLLGRLGKDPEFKKDEGKDYALCKFSLATNERQAGKDVTTWHYVTVFGKTAENVAKYLSKGSRAYVEGRITKRSYKDKQGVEREAVEVVASQVTFVDSKKESTPSAVEAELEPGEGGEILDVPF